ncbi:reverse transcriptase [Gossypium australe]|uniref:Reverse transcriptase n=1 Tax=Gossypium australe TaxID=47621 RepID=A0A5B6WE57_9ROSI|nr:reverse transcriptase [Gossypium australe]
MNQLLIEKYNEEEIVEAINNIRPTKASELDDFPTIFFQKFWHIVGREVNNFCLEVLNKGKSLKPLNHTNIMLLPKTVHPKDLTNFRPISLCTVFYKIISKSIANRLQKVLDHCIDSAQSAFVTGQLISDNVLLAYEILHTLKNKKVGKKSLMALKIDMSKAYDREWSLPQKEVYDKLRIEEGSLRKVKASRKGPQISHLFADDYVLFREATDKGTATFEKVLKEYEVCSGQCINYGKSTMFFSSNTTDNVYTTISNRLWVKRFTKYGGQEETFVVPTLKGSKVKDTQLEYKIIIARRKRGVYQNRFPSNPHIHNGMLLIAEINMRINGTNNSKFLVAIRLWETWDSLLKECGGLGYRNLAKFNLALLAKQGWRLIEDPKSLLARTLKVKYYSNTDFLSSGLGNLPSYTWKSIWAAKGLLLSGLCWRVGTGHDIRIEEDVWVPNVPGLLIKQRVKRHNITMVADLIDSNAKSWKTELIWNTFSEDDVQKILQIPLAHLPHDDFFDMEG